MSGPGLFTKKLLFLLFFSIGFFVFSPGGLAQTHIPAEETITFHARNESLRSILKRLADEYPINFTYNASDPVFDQLISYSAQNATVGQVLNTVLKKINHETEQVGNHFVIIRSAVTERIIEVKNETAEPRNNDVIVDSSVAVTVEIPEIPVILTDTIIITDTVIQFKELIIRDTIFMERKPEREVTRPQRLLRDILSIEIDQRERWAVGVSYTQIYTAHQLATNQTLTSQLQKVMDAEAVSFRNNGLGVSIQYNLANLTLAGNLGLNRFAHRFTYNELFTSGGFNLIDTLDSFFTIFQNDTLWTHITDTTWVPLESSEIIYDRMNQYLFLESGLSAGYVFYNGRAFSLYGTAALMVSTPLWYRAQTIVDTDGFPPAGETANTLNTWLWAWSAGIGVRTRLSTLSDLFLESGYRSFLNDWNTNHPLDRRVNGFSVRAGLIYYF
jgi:hypothetical protein